MVAELLEKRAYAMKGILRDQSIGRSADRRRSRPLSCCSAALAQASLSISRSPWRAGSPRTER
jgi:hypothetical protein